MYPPSPALPTLPGLTWRPLRVEDAPALHRLGVACARVDRNPRPRSPADWTARLTSAEVDLPTASLAAFDGDGALVAFGAVAIDLGFAHEARANLEGDVRPDYRRRGLGGFLLTWMEARARAVLAPRAGTRPAVLRIDVEHEGAEAASLYERHGYALALVEETLRYNLSRPIAEARLPAGLSRSAWAPETASRFFEVYRAAFQDRPGFPGWSQATWRQAFTGRNTFRPDLSVLLAAGEAGVAYALCAVEPAALVGGAPEGWILQLGVAPDWRQRGIAAGLVALCLHRFRAEGLGAALLEVGVNNPPAMALYRKLGFELLARCASFRKTAS